MVRLFALAEQGSSELPLAAGEAASGAEAHAPPTKPIIAIMADTRVNRVMFWFLLIQWPLPAIPLAWSLMHFLTSESAQAATYILATVQTILTWLVIRLWRTTREDLAKPAIQCCREGLILRLPPYPTMPVYWDHLAVTLQEEGPNSTLHLLLRIKAHDDLSGYGTRAIRWAHHRSKKVLERGAEITIHPGRLIGDVRAMYRLLRELIDDPDESDKLPSWHSATL